MFGCGRVRDGIPTSSSGMTVELRINELRLNGSSSMSWFFFLRRMSQTTKADMTAMPTIAATAIPAIDPIPIPSESPPVPVAVATARVVVAERVVDCVTVATTAVDRDETAAVEADWATGVEETAAEADELELDEEEEEELAEEELELELDDVVEGPTPWGGTVEVNAAAGSGRVVDVEAVEANDAGGAGPWRRWRVGERLYILL